MLTCASSLDTGANASAEEAEDTIEDAGETVNNVVNAFRLQSTSFDKKGFLAYLKGMSIPPKLALQPLDLAPSIFF